jgi:hypothetical protein
MTDKQELGELLQTALSEIDEAGGRERHLLSQTIGKPVYEKLLSKSKTSDLLDRWLAATGKAKGPATKALSIAIAKVADKPELVSRIERELGDSFDLPDRAPTPAETKKHAAAVDQKRNGQRVSYEKPKNVNLALLAKNGDMAKYYKARQSH